MADGRRTRCSNYTNEEWDKLIDIVLAHNINSASRKDKKKLWVKVATIYNIDSTEKRSASQLRNKYDNMKARGITMSEGSQPHNTAPDSDSADIPSETMEVMPSPIEFDAKGTPTASSRYQESFETEEETESRRPRGTNFLKEDCDRLLNIVRTYSDTIECKKLGTSFRVAKNKAWAKITELYNSGPVEKRSTNQLRIKYENFRKRWRKSARENPVGSGTESIPDFFINSNSMQSVEVMATVSIDGVPTATGDCASFTANVSSDWDPSPIVIASCHGSRGSDPLLLPSADHEPPSDSASAQAAPPENEPAHSSNEPNLSPIELANLELARLQASLAQKEFDENQRRLDAEERRKVEAHEEWKRQQVNAEERKKTIYELERRILEARLRKECE